MPTHSQTNRLLGYPADARLLIINADDFGMCHAINEAIFRALKKGVLGSTSLMVPCPWALHAMHFLADHPEIPFGIHLTVISDWVDYRWGPVTPREKVPSLIDKAGYFYNFEHMPEFLAQVRLDQLEDENSIFDRRLAVSPGGYARMVTRQCPRRCAYRFAGVRPHPRPVCG